MTLKLDDLDQITSTTLGHSPPPLGGAGGGDHAEGRVQRAGPGGDGAAGGRQVASVLRVQLVVGTRQLLPVLPEDPPQTRWGHGKGV